MPERELSAVPKPEDNEGAAEGRACWNTGKYTPLSFPAGACTALSTVGQGVRLDAGGLRAAGSRLCRESREQGLWVLGQRWPLGRVGDKRYLKARQFRPHSLKIRHSPGIDDLEVCRRPARPPFWWALVVVVREGPNSSATTLIRAVAHREVVA